MLSSGIGFGRAVDFTRFEGQEIDAPSIGGRRKDNARCFWTRRDFEYPVLMQVFGFSVMAYVISRSIRSAASATMPNIR